MKFHGSQKDPPTPRRPRMGAWIEMSSIGLNTCFAVVAPVWGRGLKSVRAYSPDCPVESPPYGGVD